MVQNTPETNSWDLQKLFGHLSFRIPALIAFREALELLKSENQKFLSCPNSLDAPYLVDDHLSHSLALVRSVRRDFDYMRARLEDLSTLVSAEICVF
jgi:hypothetical protein